jgi:Zn-dependent peptidase ImmA (M78 family)
MASGGSTKITLSPDVLRWARTRVPLTVEALARKANVKVTTVEIWEATGVISVAQVAKLAAATYSPLGYLYLPTPPDEDLPIQDFRSGMDRRRADPSPNLLDTVFAMQLRQEWMRDELVDQGSDPLPFVGSASINDSPIATADDMRATLGIQPGWAANVTSWEDAGRALRERLEDAGILVVVNGVVGNNTSRKLDPSEFRGFALADGYAPLVFVNGADAKSAQMFTLAHETAHLWLGASGVSNFDRLTPANHNVEIWCNAVAAEFLVPRDEFILAWNQAPDVDRFAHVARRFKVSAVVIARRAWDLNRISEEEYRKVYDRSVRTRDSDSGENRDSGGNFWYTQNTRVGKRFGAAVVRAVREGRLLYRDAYRLTGLHGQTFDDYAQRLTGRY